MYDAIGYLEKELKDITIDEFPLKSSNTTRSRASIS